MERPSIALYEVGNDRKTETGARLTLVQPAPALDGLRTLVGIQAGTIISDGNLDGTKGPLDITIT